MKPKRAALYGRVSTDGQTVESQWLALKAVAQRRGWTVVETYQDNGISGAKGRDKRPEFDAALKDAIRRKFDVLMVWSIDRMGGARQRSPRRWPSLRRRVSRSMRTRRRWTPPRR